MVKLTSLALGAALAFSSISPVVADSQGSFLWDPPVENEANVYARVIELQHAGHLNGNLLATWEHWYVQGTDGGKTNGTEGSFIIRQSEDNGDTWKTIATVKDEQKGPGHPCPRFWQPFFFEFPHKIGDYPKGTLLLVGNLVPENKTFTEFFTWRSTDHGKTWDPVGAWQEGGTMTAGIWEPFLYLDADGNLVAMFSDERDAKNHSQMLVHVVSKDGGDTWGEVVRDVASDAPSDRPGMPVVTRMDNDEYIMVYEICNQPFCPVYTKTSKDGQEWRESDLGNAVLSADGLYPGSAPSIVWDSDAKHLVLAGRRTRSITTTAESDVSSRAVFINKNHGEGQWDWAVAPWWVSNASSACNSNYSPNLLPRGDGVIRYTAPASQGSTGLCAERTGQAPVAVLPYQANFSSEGQLGWINFNGDWSVSDDEYSTSAAKNSDARALTGSTGWRNYEISADIKVSGSGAVGLNARVTAPMFGTNAFKGYTAAINPSTGNLTVSRQAHDMLVLKTVAVPGGVKADTWYHLSFSVSDYKLTATLTSKDGSSKTTATGIDNSFPSGAAGLWANLAGGSYKNVVIEEN